MTQKVNNYEVSLRLSLHINFWICSHFCYFDHHETRTKYVTQSYNLFTSLAQISVLTSTSQLAFLDLRQMQDVGNLMEMHNSASHDW